MDNQAPQIGWATKAKVSNIVDGDTVDIEITKVMRIRLKDVWAPETRTKNKEEKVKGLQVKDYVKELLLDKDVVVFIPGGDILSDHFTLNRVVGIVYLDEEEVNEKITDFIEKQNEG